MRLLFFKESMAWPRAKGHDVHSYYMMQALTRLGHEVSLLTLEPPPPPAIEGIGLAHCRSLDGSAAGENGHAPLALSRMQERFRSYWGIDPGRIRQVGRTAREVGAEAVVVVGLSVLPYLGQVEGALRVWYAADEWAWHHLSQVRLMRASTWGNVRQALTKGLYERAYGPLLDRVWVVSEADRRAMRWVARAREVDVIPNGVDGEYYRPLDQAEEERTCVFWGRLDFGPNVQALEWFCRRVWPAVRRRAPDARFTVYGFNPTAPVQALAGRDGIRIVPDLPDLRGEIGRHQVAVLPFVSGGGIKNKLLEAASMGRPIVCTPRACGGLRGDGRFPFAVAGSASQWVAEVLSLWADADRRRALAAEARGWVLRHHSWPAAAEAAVRGLESSLRGPTG